MKRIIMLLALCTLCSTITFTFSQTSSTLREVPAFDKLRVTSKINVYATRGDVGSVKVVASGIDIDKVVIEVVEKDLNISLSRGIYKDYNVDIYLIYTDLQEVFVNSSGRVSFQDMLVGDKVVLEVGTNSTIDTKVELASLDLIASNGGSIRLEGEVGTYKAKVKTAGILSALDLLADSVFLSVGSKGMAKVMAKELLDAKVRFGGSLIYSGNPKQKKIETGFGTTVIEQ